MGPARPAPVRSPPPPVQEPVMVERLESREQLLLELDRLNAELEQLHAKMETLRQEKLDLEIMLQTTTEHSDVILQGLKQQKGDLEILLEATTEHSDSIAQELKDLAREERRQREEEFQLITAATPVGLGITQISDGQFLYANDMMGAVFGLTATELLTRRSAEFYSEPGDRQRVLSILAQEHRFRGEVRFRRADGTPFWALLSLRPFIFQGVNTLLAVIYDITDRKQAEEALRVAEEKYRSIFENALEGIYQTTPDGRYLSVNPALAKIMGFNTPEEVIQANLEISQEYLEEDGREEFKQLLERCDQISGLERQAYKCDGTVVWISESARTVRDEQGNVLYYEGIINDITERKQAEEALRLAESKYRSIFENAVEGIYQSTPDGQYIDVNPAMARLYGYTSPQEMIAAIQEIATQIYVDADRRQEFQQLMASQDAVEDFDYQAYCQDGSKIWVSEWTRAVRDGDGNVLYYEGNCIDITKRKQEEAALKQQLQELRIEIDQTKRAREVAAIVETDYFQNLQKEVERLRQTEPIED
ncbi:MAG: PAS domain S-box protein [Leptolyngbyaceae cyanobacterium SL_7_1]|nr:PAS domain S-box protein [Leptolyngbyaceae cyanobacterium SL_7_1]